MCNCDWNTRNLYFVRLGLMLMVVFYHSILFWTGRWFNAVGLPVFTNEYFPVVAKWFISFLMEAFTLVSGYLFYYLNFECKRYESLYKYFKIKTLRLLVPYISVAFFWVIPVSYFFYKWSFQKIIDKYVLGLAPSQLWYLLMLFNVSLLAYACKKIFLKHTFFSLLLVSVLYVHGLQGWRFTLNYFMVHTSLKYLIFFLIGFKIRQFRCKNIKFFSVLILFLLHTTLFYLMNFTDICDSGRYGRLFFNLSLNILGAVWIFLLLMKLGKIFPCESNKLLLGLSENSMGIYLLHQQIIYFCIFLFNGEVDSLCNALINFILSILISLVIICYLKKYKTGRFILGE